MPIKAGLVSLGCAKNRVDSEVLLGLLRENGVEIVADPAEADMIFVNTCGFIDAAKEESINAILEMAAFKTEGHLKKLFVTGCLAQRYPDDLLREIPEIDGIMGVSDYQRLPEMLRDAEAGKRPRYIEDGERFLQARRVLTTPGYTAYVKISDGCSNRCTYCAIPMIRGPYRSRPYEDILRECRALAAQGVTELVLIAQDTSRYGDDFPAHTRLLPQLLRDVSAIEGVHWVRVLYCYPDSADDALLDEIANNPKVVKYLDLPLQHIDDDLLRRMNRRGDSALIRRVLAGCRKRGILVRTTMIVGFPGETQEQFERLLAFIREARFERLGAFTYSPEEGTPAAEMPDQIPEEEKQLRLDQLMMLQQGVSMDYNESRIGEVCEVLVEDFDAEAGKYVARSERESPESDGVIFLESADEIAPGTYLTARITGADAYDLYGEVVK